MRIVSAGCICTDVFVDKKTIAAGGETLNFCGNICRFPDVESVIIGAVGTDEYGAYIRKILDKLPIDASLLEVKDCATANHRIYHTADGDRYFKPDSWNGGAYDLLWLNEQAEKCLTDPDTRAVHTTFSSPVFERIAELKKGAGFIFAVDFNVSRDFDAMEKFLPQIDLFFISGDESIWDRLKAWSREFKTVLICTMAERGSIAFADGNEYPCSAVKVERVIDTTGAGDSFEAGFVREYCRSREIAASLHSGSECAALNIAKLGGF